MKEDYKRGLMILFTGVCLLIISFALDQKVFDLIKLIKTPLLTYLFHAASHISSVIWVLIIMTSLFMWERHKWNRIPALWLTFFISTSLCILMKILIARPRPFSMTLLTFFGLVNYSFPSTHATAVFSPIKILHKEFPKTQWFWILFAFLVSSSRVYLGFHYLSDIIAGALLGYGSGLFVVFITDKFKLDKIFYRMVKFFKKILDTIKKYAK